MATRTADTYPVPCLLAPVRVLRERGPVCGGLARACTRLVAAFILGVACAVCNDPARGVARSALPSLAMPLHSRVRLLLPPHRSAAQDSWMADCDLLDGVCVCDESAPGSARGAEADALAGMA